MSGWLLALLGAAVALRSGLGPAGAAGPALLFAATLGTGAATASISSRQPLTPSRFRLGRVESAASWARLAWGTAGAVVLVLGPLVARGGTGVPSARSGFGSWAAVAAVVAVAEEAFLRGALWRACLRVGRGGMALVVTTVAFAGMHVPFYGWRAVPLDLVAGLVLGALRLGSGSVAAPALAHVLADWAGWWLA